MTVTTTVTRQSGRQVTSGVIDVDHALAPHLDAALAELTGSADLLAGMANYHLGRVDASLAASVNGAANGGKRVRPAVALLCCAATGGDPAVAAPLAAALELLHNFTLVHDDIQDESPSRRHRPTVWRLWGVGQAINAGDALFAAAHVALYRLRGVGVSADLTLRLAEAFDRMTIDIVQGQTLDLDFEGRQDVTADDYLRMIELKTAAILRYAAWAGALLGGAADSVADRFGVFGRALGLGFQVRDDLLGIWGSAEATGKAAADDIRRRKQSLPILMLRERGDVAAQNRLATLYSTPIRDEHDVRLVLDLLAAANIRGVIEQRIASLHGEARAALESAARHGENPARDVLRSLIESLAVRMG